MDGLHTPKDVIYFKGLRKELSKVILPMRGVDFDYKYRISANFKPKLKKFQHL